MSHVLSMNLLKTSRYLINNPFILNRFDRCFYAKTLFTLSSQLNPNQSLSSPLKPTLFHNTNDHHLKHPFDFSHYLIIYRSFAKGKDKQKDKKKTGKPKVVLSDEEMQQIIPLSELKEELHKIIEKFKEELVVNINVRSNPTAIEK